MAHYSWRKDTWVAQEPDVSAGRWCAHGVDPRAGLHRRELRYGVVVAPVELAIGMAHVLAEDWLMKEGKIHRSWQRRYFTLHRAPYRLRYFASEAKAKSPAGSAGAKGCIDLTALSDQLAVM